MVPKRDLFLISLALNCDLPMPSCLSNADLLVAARGRSDLLSDNLVLPFDGLSNWSPSLTILLLIFWRLDTLNNSFLDGASSAESEPSSANFLSNSSEDFLFTCWTLAALAESIIEREREMVVRVSWVRLIAKGKYMGKTNTLGLRLIMGKMDRWEGKWFE